MKSSKRPRCLCDDKPGVRCDDEHCDLAAPPQAGKHDGCVLCYQWFHSPPHRRLWSKKDAPTVVPTAAVTAPATMQPSSAAQPSVVVPPAPALIVPPAPGIVPQPSTGTIRLGDRIETALTAAGITKERVSAWLGRPCNCQERQDRLNRLSQAAEEVLRSGAEKAKSLFSKLFGG